MTRAERIQALVLSALLGSDLGLLFCAVTPVSAASPHPACVILLPRPMMADPGSAATVPVDFGNVLEGGRVVERCRVEVER